MTSEELGAMLLEQERWWRVKIQSFNSIEHFLQYAGRYARRPPIAQRRIVKIEKGSITFWAKDKKLKRVVAIQRSPEEFIDLWVQHLLKHYQHTVRYFGLFAPRSINRFFDAIFNAIGQKRQPRPMPLRWADSRMQLSGRNPLLDQNWAPDVVGATARSASCTLTLQPEPSFASSCRYNSRCNYACIHNAKSRPTALLRPFHSPQIFRELQDTGGETKVLIFLVIENTAVPRAVMDGWRFTLP